MLAEILKNALLAPVYDVAIETPLDEAAKLSARTGHRVLLKREDQQPVFSFKLRGAYAKMAKLSPEQRARGVVAASAGNHAQGVALSARKLGGRAVIVMPVTTPEIKVEAVRALGGEVVLHGDTYDDASAYAQSLSREQGMVYVHPYDDPDVIAGQATIGLELIKQMPESVSVVFIPAGGGGLIAGIGAVLKELRPGIRIVAVEPEDAASLAAALEAGAPVALERVGRFADGVAVKKVGDLTFQIAREVVDECIQVSNDEICAAIKEIFEDRRAIVEPAGALAYAGLRKWGEGQPPFEAVAITCGANINFDSLRHVSERAEIGERREAILAVTIPERPGTFRTFCRAIGERSVTEFNYRYASDSAAHVFVGLRVRDPQDTAALVGSLQDAGFPVLDLTDDEMAKLHLRHMVGGRASADVPERLLRFEFPERAGALMQFLDAIGGEFNISLFHYRNHGSDVGRVLAGFQLPEGREAEFQARIAACGYPTIEESENPAYKMFL